MARWLHALQQFQFSIVHRAGCDHGNADGLSRVPTSPCGQCTRVDCPPVDTTVEVVDQPFDAESVGDSEDADLVPLQSGEDWLAQLDDDLSRPASQMGEIFRITALQLEDTTCITLLEWIRSDVFPPWTEVKSLCPELRFLWHHRNNLSADVNGVIWRKRSSQGSQLQLLVPRPAREQLFLANHASLFGGHLGRNRMLAHLSHRFYWSGMADDVKDWLRQCTTCMKRKLFIGHHHPLGNIPTGHHWDRIAMDIFDVCDPTPDGYHYILVIADYFSKWTEAFPIKDKCTDTVADVLVNKIILRFGMPLVIHSDQGREFENGLMKSLCTLLGCVKTRTAPYHPESDGMVERFNRTCLMMLSMFVNDRRDNWNELLPFVMHAYRTSVHESTGYSPFRLMMGLRMSLRMNFALIGNMMWPHIHLRLGCGTLWRLHMITCIIRYIVRLPGGSGYMTSRPLIVNFRWDCRCYDTTLRPLKRNWDLYGSGPNKSSAKLPAIQWAFKRDRTPPLCLFTWMI